MQFFAVFGNPISHSKSPLLHNYVFYKLGIEARYTRYLLEKSHNFRDLFFSLGLSGANITLPYKEILFEYCDEIRGIANNIGAINTIVKKDSKLIGYNTDANGFFKNIEYERIKNALILGAGGSARAIACILREHNITPLIANRSPSKLQFFKQNGFEVCLYDDTLALSQSFDIIINATSSSINGELPLEESLLHLLFSHATIAFDLMYGKECKFLTLAQNHNLKTYDGAKMLLYQAITASSLFLDTKEDKIAKYMNEIYEII